MNWHTRLASLFVVLALTGCAQGTTVQAVAPNAPHSQENNGIRPEHGGGGGGGGSGQCPGGDSGFVPAGYNCVESSTEEFNGSSIDTSRWVITGTPGGQGPGTGCISNPSGGYVEAFAVPYSGGTTSCGLKTIFPMPDAPMYLEYRFRFAAYTRFLYQFWTGNCNLDACNPVPSGYAETDIDLGQFNGCNTLNPNASPDGLCSALGGQDFEIDGQTNVHDGNWHVIGYQRLPDPAPNGTLNFFVDGTLVRTITGLARDNWVFPSKYVGTGSWGEFGSPHDIFDMDQFCVGGCGNASQEVDWDYLRVYTPSGLPNGY